MKQCFTKAGVRHADWYTANRIDNFFRHTNNNGGILSTSTAISQLSFPIISKSLFGSRGIGNTKHDNLDSLNRWLVGKNLSNYIFEKFIPFSREYRLHISNNGCFYTCRKLIKNTAPSNTWQRHDDVCSWILENNSLFKKPSNWQAIINDCIKAKNALGLDVCAFDVMVQGDKEGSPRREHNWIICESCSAPSFGEITLQKYKEEISKLINQKYNEFRRA